ncbi:unnamed protein product [Kuraishia capsulata CBS 1993]|uniref:Uncharacterized protein n=1 Tax=Kuraishia capsulata CBS 1993 TaxID=1382522 RepID=W6MFT8_9ASCO|nr:uncharacterized protein KUCA_T00000454001 [Kuraishia capsulata CBS 1993]CDK24491.1 unnamed protein product [Kuraishia capsulata CBS 1993]
MSRRFLPNIIITGTPVCSTVVGFCDFTDLY